MGIDGMILTCSWLLVQEERISISSFNLPLMEWLFLENESCNVINASFCRERVALWVTRRGKVIAVSSKAAHSSLMKYLNAWVWMCWRAESTCQWMNVINKLNHWSNLSIKVYECRQDEEEDVHSNSITTANHRR